MTFRARDLRVVSNVTRDYDGGYTVETADGWIVAGPYVTKDAAKQAKTDIVAGRPVSVINDAFGNRG